MKQPSSTVDVTHRKRTEIVTLHEQTGKTYRDIANIVGVSLATVSRVIKSKKETGSILPKRRGRCGRKRKTTAIDNEYIIRESRKDPRKTSDALKRDLEEAGIEVSSSTVRRRLLKAEPVTENYSNESKVSTGLNLASETLSSANSLLQHDSLSQPSAAKLQKTTDRQFGDQFFEGRRQVVPQSTLRDAQPLSTRAQKQVVPQSTLRDVQTLSARIQKQVVPQSTLRDAQPLSTRTQKQVVPQSTLRDAQPLSARTQKQVQQHLQVTAPPPAPSQPAPRQVKVMAPPIQVPVAKPKPVEKPRPREKRIFVVADHQRCVMSNLASLWKSGKLCDAGLGNGSSTVMVHKVVLSAVCPKLLSVFSTDTLSQKFLQVNFPGEVSTEALNAFAEYMYNGILDLDRDILEQLKIIAKRLDMKEFEQLCDSHLPNHMHQPASAAATSTSFTSVPLIQTTMPIPPMTSSLAPLGSTVSISMQSAPSITTQALNVKQEIAELAQVQRDTAAVFGQESKVGSLAPNKSGNAAGFVICPSVKTEPVGPEDDKYGHLSGSSNNNQAFTSTTSPSTSITTTSLASVPASSTEFSIPFLEITDVKSTRLKTTHPYEAPLVSDLSSVSSFVEAVCPQSSPINVDSSKGWLSTFTSSLDGGIYPVGLFTAGGDNLPLLTTETDVKTIDLYETDLT